MTKPSYSISLYNENYHVNLYRSAYTDNDTLAVMLITEEGEPFATITVNLDASDSITDPACAFIDTNNCPWAEEFLKKNEIGTPTGIYGRSGWCSYPLYRFNIDKIPLY